MQSSNNGLGRYGEEVAARWLAKGGLTILERNWRCVEGELDIVALDGETLAVCEVKTRSERGFQQPTEAIDRVKADRLRRLAERWLGERWPTHFSRLAQSVVADWKGEAAADGGREGPGGSQGNEGSQGNLGSAHVDVVPAPPTPRPGVPARWTTPTPPGGVRIDLIAVVSRLKGPALVEHLRGVV